MTSSHTHPDAISHSPQRRQAHALTLLVAVAALGAVTVLNLVDDPRPLDVQLSGAFADASKTLNGWQDQLSRGLQVSLLAVADGHDVAPDTMAPATLRETAASMPTTGTLAQ